MKPDRLQYLMLKTFFKLGLIHELLRGDKSETDKIHEVCVIIKALMHDIERGVNRRDEAGDKNE